MKTTADHIKTTADYIDALRVKLNVDSDYLAMHALGVDHRTQVSRWRKCKGAFGEELSIKVADALEIDRAEVLLAMQVQKESNEEIRKLWERIANLSMGVTAVLSVVALLPIVGVPIGDDSIIAMAGLLSPVEEAGALYIM